MWLTNSGDNLCPGHVRSETDKEDFPCESGHARDSQQ